MKGNRMRIRALVAVTATLGLFGCQTPAPAPAPSTPPPAAQAPARPPPPPVAAPAPPPVPVPTPGERALAAGIALYDAGDYPGAIRSLQAAREIWDDPAPAAKATKLAARKHIAFSFCVTGRRPQCRQQFVDALLLDPTFDLDPAEKSHPIWGAEFDRAKKQVATPPPRPPAARPAAPPAAK